MKVLFQKYLNNECSEAEVVSLLEFFGIEENEQLLKSLIYSELENEVNEDELDLADIDERLAAIYDRVKPRVPVIRMYWRRIAAAAVVACAVVVYMVNQHEPAPRFAGNIIQPGKDQAILRLADGRAISLNDLKEGEVANVAGVRIQKAANGQLIYEDLNEGNEVQYNSIEAPAGGQWQLILPDGSHVWLNSASVLKYPTRFKGGERKVELEGEAYFEIAADKAKPFRVQTRKQTVEVLGTDFNIMSYPDDISERTTLFEGAVKVIMSGNAKTLKPGEQVQVSAAGIQSVLHPDLEEALAWKNGYFKFNGTLEDIMSRISRWYNVEIVYVSKPDPNYTFEGEISRNKDLNEVLKIMEYTGKVHFSVKERRIEVRN